MNKFKTFPWQIIHHWYEKNGRTDLPWRNYTIKPKEILFYRVWISEILLQQTQAERVVPFFEKIITQFPDIHTLASTDYDTFFPYYQGMGYYSRAKNILKTAKIIHKEYQNIFPNDKEKLKKLPGIGEYTSSAILAFGYGESFLAWDTNLEKVFSRYFFGTQSQKLSNEEKYYIENSFCDYISNFGKESKKAVRIINNGLMDFARKVDAINPKNIDWKNYPIKQGKWYETRGKADVGVTRKKDIFPIPDAKIIVILHENHKKYFSLHQEYKPFILNAIGTRNTREYVKNYFSEQYNLQVSVRPIHKKYFFNNIPFIWVNVQIQVGENTFYPFDKKIVKTFFKNFHKE